ncbi:MAG: hypothetical protein FWG71_00450 [Synergistaceae bacterium]|nr:hypothetical protein [Synergistaceae bacterium]
MMYKPLVDREEDIRAGGREEGWDQGWEAAYRTAVEGGASDEVLKRLARTGGLSVKRTNEINNEVAELL